MPHDMFGDVIVRPRSVRARRSSLVILSVVAHGAAIIALVIVPLFAADVLPGLPRSVTFIPDGNILPVVPLAPVHHTKTPSPPQDRTAGEPEAAPTHAPSGITQETDLLYRGTTEPVGSPDGLVGGLTGVGVVFAAPAAPPPPPPPPPLTPVHLHAGIVAPQKLVDMAPIYPPMAQQAHMEGIVIVEATIDTHGNVIAVKVLKSTALLDQAALSAVKQWKYTPALLNGVPVPVLMTVTVNFRLR